MDSHLSDPVTRELFTHPIVLSCGHTIDKTSIPDDRLCPICRKRTNQTHVVNWAIAGILNLSIPDRGTDIPMPDDVDREFDKYIEEKVMQITQEMVKNASGGRRSASIHDIHKTAALDIVEILRNLGYDAEISVQQLVGFGPEMYRVGVMLKNKKRRS